MLENYYKNGAINTDERTQRLIAVQAALEIAKASVGNSHAANVSRVEDDLKSVATEINNLANSIQNALKR